MPAAVILDRYLEVDGTPLATPAYTATLVDGTGGQRGDNWTAPALNGDQWSPGRLAPAVRTLVAWVTCKADDGTLPATDALRRGQRDANLDVLKALFGVAHRPLVVRRKMHTVAGAAVWRRTEARAVDPVVFADDTRDVATFTVDLLCHDPRWYAEVDTVHTVPLGSAAFTNPGSAPASTLTVRMIGPLTNPSLTNSALDPDIVLAWTGVLAGGEWVEMALPDRQARRNTGAVAGWGVLQRTNAFELLPGANGLTLAASAGSGSCTVTYRAPYL